MKFDTKAFNKSSHLSNERFFSTKCFFQHTYVHLNEKFVQMFFVKSHESNFSIVTEMV